MSQRFYVETLGCPKNQVDSDKLAGTLLADGMQPTAEPEDADLVVVNTCAFIEAARQESIDTVLALAARRRGGARLVVTGCMAERYGTELADALPEIDQVAGFGVRLHAPPAAPQRTLIPVRAVEVPDLDLLNLPRPRSSSPWAYVKIAEGCDRACGFCAIPSFRGPQRSRSVESILAEVDELRAREIVLVAQDLASYGKDVPDVLGAGSIVPLVRAVADRVDRVRLLYLYPSDLSDALIDTVCDSGVPYFDLSLQHVSKPLLRRMRRWGDGDRFLRRIADIRRREPDAAFRSNFIVGYPGETERHHDELLRFVEEAQLDWCGFFAFSREDGTYAADLDGQVPSGLVADRLGELTELQDAITATRRDQLIGRDVEVLVDAVGVGRTHREAPEIDGVVHVGHDLGVGDFVVVSVADALGPDLVAAGVDIGHVAEVRLMVDPSALATWANAITVGRLLLSPLMFWAIPSDNQGAWPAFVLWFLLCASDGIDGYIARRHGVTRSGAFLDPLADKVLVLGAMFTLVGNGVFWIVPVAIIAVREFVISMYRTVAGSKGVSVPASRMAKNKTLAQQLAVGFALLPLTAVDATWLWNGFLWLAVVLAVVSGWEYLRHARGPQAEAAHAM